MLPLAEAKQLTAALQAEMVPTQVTVVGERRGSCDSFALSSMIGWNTPWP
jgi:hypothetical protein